MRMNLYSIRKFSVHALEQIYDTFDQLGFRTIWWTKMINQSCKSKVGLRRLLCKYDCLDVLTMSAKNMVKEKYK